MAYPCESVAVLRNNSGSPVSKAITPQESQREADKKSENFLLFFFESVSSCFSSFRTERDHPLPWVVEGEVSLDMLSSASFLSWPWLSCHVSSKNKLGVPHTEADFLVACLYASGVCCFRWL